MFYNKFTAGNMVNIGVIWSNLFTFSNLILQPQSATLNIDCCRALLLDSPIFPLQISYVDYATFFMPNP